MTEMEHIIELARDGRGLNPAQTTMLFRAYEEAVKDQQRADQEARWALKCWSQAREGILPGLMVTAASATYLAKEAEIARLRNELRGIYDYVAAYIEWGAEVDWYTVAAQVANAADVALAGQPTELVQHEPVRDHSGERG